MSLKCMSEVWDIALPTNEKFLLLCLADWASDDGSNVFPSISSMSMKTAMSYRTVQRMLEKLCETGVLEQVVKHTQHRPARYKIWTSRGVKIGNVETQTGQIDKSKEIQTGQPRHPDRSTTTPDRTTTTSRPVTVSSNPLVEPLEETVREPLPTVPPTTDTDSQEEKKSAKHADNCPCTVCKLARGEDPDGGKPARPEKQPRSFRRRNGVGAQRPAAEPEVVPVWFERFLTPLREVHGGTLHPRTATALLATSVEVLGEDGAVAAWTYCLETTRKPSGVLWEFSAAPKSFTPPAGWVPTGKHVPRIDGHPKRGDGKTASGMTAEEKAKMMAEIAAELEVEESRRRRAHA